MEQHSQSASLAQDRASLSSGSSGGSSAADWYDRPRAVHAVPPSVPPKSPRHVPRCQCCPPERPPKPPSPKKAAPCQRAIPGHAQPLQQPSKQQQQVEEHNYDVPRSFLHARMQLQDRHSSLDYYDTPKKFREAIEYSNYDTPPMAKSVRPPCGCSTLPSPRRPDNSPQRDIRRDCLPHLRKEAPRAHCAESSLDDCTGMPYVWRGDKRGLQVAARMASDVAGGSCPCQRVMCWSLPCRRGSGAEDTGIPIHKVRLNGEGRMPVRDPSGQLAVLYATVDKTKKKPRPLPSPNYVNISEMSTPQHANYANMDFAQSLENYENARDILQRAGITKESLDLCHKCGHAPEQYLMMEPRKPMFPGIPGYLTMSPANLGRASSIPALTSRHPPLPGEVSNSNERQQSVLMQRKRSSSADASRFLSDEEEAPADSSQQLQSESTSTLSDCTQINPMTDSDLSSREVEGEMKERLATLPRSTLEELKERPVAVHIRRSSSVPCKTGHNRDSSSSNDSGVSAGSPHFPDLDTRPVCLHSSLPRRCRSSDPLKDMARAQTAIPAKSSSAEAEVPISVQPTKGGGNNQTISTNGETSTPGVPPCPDSHSTSSGTSDMSDYIETLSLSSHSSSDINDSLRLGGRPATTTLRPRSGREYHNRAFIDTDLKVKKIRKHKTLASQ
ncbi:hypothetical protein B566_EDAN004829 [Ephemera danica]|nr:hypothetical protein B566_EDAN004829 [Ephemera danica]